MIRRGLLACLAALVLAGVAGAAEIRVKIAAPRVRVEKSIPAPGRGYVWTSGCQRWDGRAYVWVPGTWVQPLAVGAGAPYSKRNATTGSTRVARRAGT